MSQAITPNLWFNGNAEEAVEYYVSVFPNSEITLTAYYPNEDLLEFQKEFAGKVLSIDFSLNGNRFTAINAGPEFKFNESVSFAITCENQDEIDYYWRKLSAVPESEQCGWCKDKYGLSWQVVPASIERLMEKPGAYAKLLQMKKIVIADF